MPRPDPSAQVQDVRRRNPGIRQPADQQQLAQMPGISPVGLRTLEIAEETVPERLVIDLSELEFIDSSGLHELMRADHHATKRSRRLSLRRGPRAVQRLFELTDAQRLFCFED